MSAQTGEEGALSPVVDGPRASSSPQLWSRSDRSWDRFRHGLLLCWLLVVVAIPLTGERVASWSDVRDLVAAGKVQSVSLSGELQAGERGFVTVQVRWQRGPLQYTAEVVQVGGPGRAEGIRAAATDVPALRQPPSSRLRALQPGLEVTHGERLHRSWQLFGWQVPSSLGVAAFALFLVGLGLLVAGPHPWRATRWAWFWLLVTPVGILVFLVLSGPTPGVPGPKNPQRRLTGGWAFLLSIPLASVLAPMR
ncbi:MAG TPA: hypothetical protein VLB29_07895 [Nocardioidaceae bacterium]|nr:hypothetical protein [Nocardioidaceae bacterium]